MKKIALFVMLTAAIVFFSPQAGSAGLTKLWGDGLNISGVNNPDGSTIYGYGHKASDGSIFVYYSVGTSVGGSAIYLQKVGKNGEFLWGGKGSILYADTYSPSYSQPFAIDLAPDQDGGAIAVFSIWSELRAKRFDSSGNEDTSWGTDGVLIASNRWSWYDSAITDSVGGAIVVWRGGIGGMGIYAQRVGSDGQLKWNNGEPVWVGYGTLYHGWTQANNAISDGKGGVFIAWDGYIGSEYSQVLTQYFDSHGIPQWQEGGVVAIPVRTDGRSPSQSDIILDATGGIILSGNTGSSVIVQRISSQGDLLWGSEGVTLKDGFHGELGSNTFTYIEAINNNEFAVVWHEATSWSESGIYAQKVDINGNLKWSPAGVLVSVDGFNFFPKVKTDGANGVWVSFINGEVWGPETYIGIQHLDNNANPFACKPLMQIVHNEMETWGHSLISDSEGGVFSVWGGSDAWGNIFAQRFSKVGNREVCGAISVTIDIKPGNYPNSIKLQDTGNIPVAIFSSDTFDASTIDVASLELNGAGVRIIKGKGLQYSFEDVNGDGLLDLMVHFDRGALQLTIGDTVATVTGMILDGNHIQGTDSVKVIE